MQNLYSKLSAAALLMLSASASFAGTVIGRVPEPGVLELAGIGLAVAIAVSLRKRK